MIKKSVHGTYQKLQKSKRLSSQKMWNIQTYKDNRWQQLQIKWPAQLPIMLPKDASFTSPDLR